MILFGLLLFLPLVVLAALLKSLLRLLEEIFFPSYLADSPPKQENPEHTKK
jgi:uncharacterized membrane protein